MNEMIRLAERQLIGYLSAKKGYSLSDLILEMGLTVDEWNIIKSESNLDIGDFEILEIEDCLIEKKI